MTGIVILGPIEVRAGARSMPMCRKQQRLILGVLAADEGRAVMTDRLIDLIWGERPPRTARSVLQSRISELRSSIAAFLGAAAGDVEITHAQSSYRLDAAPGVIDAKVFTDGLRASQGVAEPSLRRDELRALLGLWRGPSFGELGAQFGLAAWSGRLDAARLTAYVGEVTQLAAENPSRERLVEASMLALYRSGRAAEALRAFDVWMRWLRDELGAAPSARLREVHLSVLRDRDPRCEWMWTAVPFVPAQRASGIADRVGRG
jgi:DNA-binding SARP family transcriptional activator